MYKCVHTEDVFRCLLLSDLHKHLALQEHLHKEGLQVTMAV